MIFVKQIVSDEKENVEKQAIASLNVLCSLVDDMETIYIKRRVIVPMIGPINVFHPGVEYLVSYKNVETHLKLWMLLLEIHYIVFGKPPEYEYAAENNGNFLESRFKTLQKIPSMVSKLNIEMQARMFKIDSCIGTYNKPINRLFSDISLDDISLDEFVLYLNDTRFKTFRLFGDANQNYMQIQSNNSFNSKVEIETAVRILSIKERILPPRAFL